MACNPPSTEKLHLIGLLNDDKWKVVLPQFEQPYFKSLEETLQNEYDQGKEIFPQRELIFNALHLTPLEKVKVVIVGQDPYHGEGQAMGLAFSVPIGIPVPHSLRNIYKMLYNDPNIPEFVIPNHGCLENWARQGVLLLNSTLTVEAGMPNSHAKIGWQYFTDEVIKIVSDYRDHVVFILMGEFAKTKKSLIDENKHAIIETTHPESRGSDQIMFQDSFCFSNCNDRLLKFGQSPVHWNEL